MGECACACRVMYYVWCLASGIVETGGTVVSFGRRHYMEYLGKCSHTLGRGHSRCPRVVLDGRAGLHQKFAKFANAPARHQVEGVLR